MRINYSKLDLSLINSSFVAISIVISFYIVLVLILNTDRGFDITDDSFYIMWAKFPENVSASVNSFGFYTRLVYLASGENVATFRFLGVVILVFVAFLFSKELYQYTLNLTKIKPSRDLFLLFSIPVTMASLAYFRYWLITPSYNWLNLIGIVIFSIGLLKLINLNASSSNFLYNTGSVLVALGGGLTFVSKPTTTIILIAIAVVWALFHYKHIRWKQILIFVPLFSILLLSIHVFVFEGSYVDYYNKITKGVFVLNLLGAGHSLIHAFENAQLMLVEHTVKSFYIYRSDILMQITIVTLLSSVIMSTWVRVFSPGYGCFVIRTLLLMLVIYYAFSVYDGVLRNSSKTHLWISVFELMFVLSAIAVVVKWAEIKTWVMNEYLAQSVFLVIFLNLLNIAFSFGTGNNFIHVMSGGAIFSISSLVFLAVLVDDKSVSKCFLICINIAVICYIYVVIDNAYQNPYRLGKSIDAQNVQASLSINEQDDNIILVDTATANYINNLQSIALSNGWSPGGMLIDMTGGSPGANVILDAGFFGFPWLVGGYSGSEEFVFEVLSGSDTTALESAWILTAPEGVRRLPLNLLINLGLDFPGGYYKVGTVKSPHRNEVQELWKVKS